MNRQDKWAEYHRILSVVYSACWDCQRPCADCRDWARRKAFTGREDGGSIPTACAATYAAVTEMERRGTSILITWSADP
jgi:hypothetical protein